MALNIPAPAAAAAIVTAFAAWTGVALAADCPPLAGERAVAERALDGNTVALADGSAVRLAFVAVLRPPLGSDDPDGGPDGLAEAARAALDRLVAGASLQIAPVAEGTDRHGRVRARVGLANGREVAHELVAAGLARLRWVDGLPGCFRALLAAESAARAAGLGLWSDPDYAVLKADDLSLASRNGLYELVEGRVMSVGQGSRMVFVDFGRNVREDFTVMLTPGIADKMTADGVSPDDLAGRRVRVRGVIEESGGPAIRLSDPAELELID